MRRRCRPAPYLFRRRESDTGCVRDAGSSSALLYLAPALAFVLAFTAYPFAQMVWMSLNNWSLISPPKFVGGANYVKAWHDPQFWVSLGFTFKYTALITPILMVLGFLIALLVAENRPLTRLTRAVVFAPVVIGLGASSLLWYWLFSYDYGLVNRGLVDLGITAKPVLWFGADAGRLALGGDRIDRLEGAGLRHAALRRRDPGHPRRRHRRGEGRRRRLLAADAAHHAAADRAHHPPGHARQRHRLAAWPSTSSTS